MKPYITLIVSYFIDEASFTFAYHCRGLGVDNKKENELFVHSIMAQLYMFLFSIVEEFNN